MDDVVEMQVLKAGEDLTGVVGDQLDVCVERTVHLEHQPRQRPAGNPLHDYLYTFVANFVAEISLKPK